MNAGETPSLPVVRRLKEFDKKIEAQFNITIKSYNPTNGNVHFEEKNTLIEGVAIVHKVDESFICEHIVHANLDNDGSDFLDIKHFMPKRYDSLVNCVILSLSDYLKNNNL
ncbi:hypothetical protein V7128_26415 [Neobacillus vireti]|uniref:hypothetical protein n=1 Tax=Neobacillus vireti TaxID=220686 RepID=UPI002FFFD202